MALVMGEASLTLLTKESNTKKRKNEMGQISKNKKLVSNYASSSPDTMSAVTQKNTEEMKISSQMIQTFKKN